MNYPYYGNPYMPPMQDNLAQLRQQQMQAIPPMPQNPLPQSGVQWVSGEQEARSWMVAPNAAVALWDSTAPTVYLKQADASGKPTLKVYDLVERLASAPDTQKAPAAEYVTRKEFDALAALVSEMKGKKRKEEKSDEESVFRGNGRRQRLYADGAAVQTVQGEFPGRPQGRGGETAAKRQAHAAAVEPAPADGEAISKSDGISKV